MRGARRGGGPGGVIGAVVEVFSKGLVLYNTCSTSHPDIYTTSESGNPSRGK